MVALVWNDSGQRIFESGLDRGVFFSNQEIGYVWNGLVSVSESLSGGEATPYYYDGEKYLNVGGPEEFGGTIEAYTYPDEFAECDGTHQMFDGMYVNLQQKKSFGLSYRTGIGNDVSGLKYGYKIHIIYNMLVSASDRDYTTSGEDVEALTFSWDFTTMPVYSKHLDRTYRTAHVVIDSTKVSPGLLRSVERYLYGSETRSSSLISFDKLIYWFSLGGEPLELISDKSDGLSYLIEGFEGGNVDMLRTDIDGLVTAPPTSRLAETLTPGFNTLETN